MVGTAYPMKVSEALLTTARDEPLKAIDMVNAFSHSSLGNKPSFPGPGMWLHGSNRALMRRMQAGQPTINLFHHDFSVCNRYAGGLQAAALVQCPTHFILGLQESLGFCSFLTPLHPLPGKYGQRRPLFPVLQK